MANPRRGKTQVTTNKKTNGVPLPKKSESANNAAKTIKRETVAKTSSNKKAYSADSRNNVGRTSGKDYSKEYSTAKTKASNYVKNAGKTLKKEWSVDKVKKDKKAGVRTSSNHHSLSTEAKDIQNRGLSGALEGNNVFDKVFNPMGKFISNAMDSTIDNSPLGAVATLATGKRISDGAYYDNPYEEQRHQGISAGAGRMAGMALNYGLMRSGFGNQLDSATNAVMNGTRVGQAIKSSSVLGKIGQSVGTKAAQDIGRGLVKETISDATLGFGQNALINYGEGLRGEDFWKQQAKDTALDFLVGGAMEGVGIGSQIRGIGREARAITGQSATDTLADAVSRNEYLDTLLDRVKGLDETRFGDRSDISKLKNASDAKADEFMQEYQNVSRMSNKKFKGYQNGEFVYDSGTTKSELLAEARRRGLDVSDKTTKKELKEILGINRSTAEETAEAYTKAKRPKKGINQRTKEEYVKRFNKEASNETPSGETVHTVNKETTRQTAQNASGKGISDDYFYSVEPNRTVSEEVYARKIQPEPVRQTEVEAPKEQPTSANKKPRENGNEVILKRYKEKAGKNATEEDLKELKGYVEKKNWKKADALIEEINKRGTANTSQIVEPTTPAPRTEQKAEKPAKVTEETPRKSVKEIEPQKAEMNKPADNNDPEKTLKTIERDIKNKLGDRATNEEREALMEYARKGDWGDYEKLYGRINSRLAKTDKSHKGEVIPHVSENAQHRTVSSGNTKEVDIRNLQNKYPNATGDEIEELYNLRESGDFDGMKNIIERGEDRALLKEIKENHSYASDTEIDELFKYKKNGDDAKYSELSDKVRKRAEAEIKKKANELKKRKDLENSKAKEEEVDFDDEVEEIVETESAPKERRFIENFERDDAIRNATVKAESLRNIDYGKKINRKNQKLTEQEAFYNSLIDRASAATSDNAREKWLDLANEIKGMDYKGFKALDKNAFLGKNPVKRGSASLPQEGLEAVGLKQAWKPLKIEETKAYGDGIKGVNQAMAVLREMARDFQDNALTTRTEAKFHLKKNAPFTPKFISEFTGWKDSMGESAALARVNSILKKAGIKDSTKLSNKDVARLTGVDLHTINANLKKSRFRRYVVEPDVFSPVLELSKATGRSEDEIREWVRNSKDMHFDSETHSLIIDPKKPHEFKEGYVDELKARMSKTNSKEVASSVKKRIDKEIDDLREIVDRYQKNNWYLSINDLAAETKLPRKDVQNYVKYLDDLYINKNGGVLRSVEKETPEYSEDLIKYYIEQEESFADTIDTEAILRELREGGGATKPAETVRELPKKTEMTAEPQVKAEEPAPSRQELPKRTEQQAVKPTAISEDDILDYYTGRELSRILRENGFENQGVKGSEARRILRENGITRGNFRPNGNSVNGKAPQETLDRLFPNGTETKAQGKLPQGKKVNVEAATESVPKKEELPNKKQQKAQKYKEDLQSVRDGKKDWRTLDLDPMRTYGSQNVGVKGATKMRKQELIKAIDDVLSGKVRSKFDKVTTDELIEKYLKMKPDFLSRGTDAKTAVKGTDISPKKFLDDAEAKGYRVDREQGKAFFSEEKPSSDVTTSKVEYDAPKTSAEAVNEKTAPKERKPVTKADLSGDEEDWLNRHNKKIDRYFSELSGISKTTYEGERGLSLEIAYSKLDYSGTEASFARILEAKGYKIEDIGERGVKDLRIKPKSSVSDATTTIVDAPSSKTSSYDTTFADYKGGTYTFTASDSLPKKGEPNFVRRGGAKAKQKVKGELPKGQKVSGNPKKKLELNSKFKDVIERFKGTDARDALDEAGEAIKKFRGSDTSKTWETYLNSEDIAPETKRLIIKRRETNQGYIKEVLTDEKVVAQAKKNIKDDFEGTVSALTHKIQNGERFTKQDNADLLMAAQHYDEIGEFRKADELYAMSQPEITNAAQVLAFQRWHYKTTPAGRAYSAITVARKIAKENNAKNIKINDKLIEAIYNAKTESEITKAMDAFKLDVWNQIPPSFAEKANAWRYLAMLGNPKTHIRNHLGNALFIPARVISDSFATVVERGLSKRLKSLGGNSGNHAILNRLNADDRALIKAGAESFKEHHAAMASASSKYFDMARPFDSPVFTGKHLNWLSKKNTDLLEGADKMYMGITYRSAYAQYMKAHGIKASQITSEIAEKASKYAENEALKATYRDPNQLASALSKFRRNLKPTSKDSGLVAAGKTATGFLMDSTVPFVKTPLNILKRGTLEYSPVGVARGIYDIVRAQDADQLLKGIGYFANGLTGTGVLALGFYLGNKGFVNGSLGDYNKKVAYDKTLGAQDYAVTIGDTSITLDWVAPMSMPFFVGVEAGANTETGGDVWTFIDALSNMTNPVFEMSMLQGIENTFNTAMQGEKGIATIAKNAAFNYVSQYVPTLSGQFTRAFVNQNRKTALSTATNPLQREVEKQLGKIINKTPLSNGLSQDYVDQWGRVEANDNKGLSALENFLSPAYISKKNVTPVDTEIQRLYEKLDEENKDSIIPTVNTNAFKQEFDGKEYVMTPAEFTQYKKTVGQAKYNGLDKLFKTTAYKNASDDEKRKMIQNVYDEANLQGKKEYLTKVSKEYASAPDFYALDSSQREKYDETLDISKQKWATAYNSLTSTYNEVKRNSGESLTTAEKAFILASNGITTLEQAQTFNKNINEKTWERALNAKKNGKTIEQMMKDAEARKDMTESERDFDSRFRVRADDRRSDNVRRVVSDDLYSKALKAFQNADKSNDDNGTVRQEEAINAIEYLTQAYGLSREQQACLWYLAQNDEGWKKTPYGKWKG